MKWLNWLKYKKLKTIRLFTLYPIPMRWVLNITLFVFITVIMGFLTYMNYNQLNRQNEKLFNIQMVHAAALVDVLISMNLQQTSLQQLAKLLNTNTKDQVSNFKVRSYTRPQTQEFYNIYREAFSFQVYSTQDQHMILRSSNAPKTPIDVPDGFNVVTLVGDQEDSHWYVYSISSQYQPVKIVISVSQKFKQQVFMDLFLNLLKEILWLYFISAVLLTILVHIIFTPLLKIATAIRKRDPRNIEPIVMKRTPKEVQPLINQLNRLFDKFNKILERESRFAGDAAHELKTPLAGIKTQIEVALNIDDIDAVKDKMRIALKNMDRYHHIIDQLLTLTRLEPQETLVEKNQKVEINRFAAHWIAEMAPIAIEKDIELSLSRSSKTIDIIASTACLDILFRNLLDNAIRYTPSGGHVDVSITKEKKHVLISFSDNGEGVPPNKLSRIFDRFYRLQGTGEKGSGLGLSIVKEIVRLHEGSVKALVSKNGGLEIQIRLPICQNNYRTKIN